MYVPRYLTSNTRSKTTYTIMTLEWIRIAHARLPVRSDRRLLEVALSLHLVVSISTSKCRLHQAQLVMLDLNRNRISCRDSGLNASRLCTPGQSLLIVQEHSGLSEVTVYRSRCFDSAP